MSVSFGEREKRKKERKFFFLENHGKSWKRMKNHENKRKQEKNKRTKEDTTVFGEKSVLQFHDEMHKINAAISTRTKRVLTEKPGINDEEVAS